MIDLHATYAYNNKRYFGGKLPTSITLEWSSLLPEDFLAGSHIIGEWRGWTAACGPRPKPDCHLIRIHPILAGFDAQAHMTLLHEQVHIKACLGNRYLLDHGKYFQAEMLRLAKAGAFNFYW